ncbi:putative F-box/LRR-repeat protein at3g18150 [Phtheirospermum japonicum]|uniref:Putative F-box/LRR-repeat protein at3g18150 n=1 Tax=Phtheirospermum japonicum TaxID=374723 RepID=A0A830BSP9_9LAMI|nr:putative F-box/LRR-repeat protein at3g18150 [Phtheirospermum japonicum]
MNNSEIINADAANGEFWIPELLIQHIQSFLSGKEAIQTSILSKSWYNAWLTRPNLDFNGRDWGVKRFLEFAKKTMQRYGESNLIIESFSLSMDRRKRDDCVLGDELIARALKLGATESYVSIRLYLGGRPFLTTNAWELRNLRLLQLEWLNIDPLFSDGSSCEFPCLKVLTLRRCSAKGIIRISSPSLECISFAHTAISRATLDVPNIRKFTFLGRITLPSLDFEAIAPMGWVSDLSIVFGGVEFKTSCFLKLEKFLEELSPSKISLNLEIETAFNVVYDYARHIECLRKPAVVENLMVKLHPMYIIRNSTLLESLFRSVEPKFTTQYWEDLQRRKWRWKTAGDNFLHLLCKALMLDVVSENCCQSMSRLPGLEKVNVECFEAALAKWRPLSLKTLLDASTSLEDKQIVRFQLTWR